MGLIAEAEQVRLLQYISGQRIEVGPEHRQPDKSNTKLNSPLNVLQIKSKFLKACFQKVTLENRQDFIKCRDATGRRRVVNIQDVFFFIKKKIIIINQLQTFNLTIFNLFD